MRRFSAVMPSAGGAETDPTDGTESIQELKPERSLEEGGGHTGTAVGNYRDITDRYIRDREQERYRQIVYSSDRFNLSLRPGRGCTDDFRSAFGMRGVEVKYQFERFFSRLRQGEFCPKSDIIILNELFTRIRRTGSDPALQREDRLFAGMG